MHLILTFPEIIWSDGSIPKYKLNVDDTAKRLVSATAIQRKKGGYKKFLIHLSLVTHSTRSSWRTAAQHNPSRSRSRRGGRK